MAQHLTLRKIAERMGWGPATVLRRHKLDDFPLYLDWTKRGLIWVTSDELIHLWEQMKVNMCQGARLRNPPRPRRKPTYQPYNWRLRYKNETLNETVGPTRNEGESRQPLHEEPSPLPPEPPCPCSRCSPHLHPEQAKIEREYWAPVIAESEPLPEPMTTPRPEGCTCGTGIPCAVC